MIKRHSRLIEYFITVGIDFESVAPINDDSISNPIRSLRIISEKEEIPDGYEQITTTLTGKDASLTKRGMISKNTKFYLCYSREGNDELFTRINYIKTKYLTKEWTRVPGKIQNGKSEYCLCVKNDISVPPIADICVISIDGKEECPLGYIKLPQSINGLNICFRHLPMDALGLRYQTCILDRYPRTDYANSPLSNTVAVFCQPNGADIRSQAQMPTFLSFVLTDSEGKKMYAITVTFYDILEEEDENECIRSLESIYTDGFKPKWPSHDNNHLYHSKSVCILSYYPFFLSFRECLKEIYRLANSPGKIPIERYIINLCEETPLPIPSRLNIKLLYAHKPILFSLPNEDNLPLLDSNIKKIFCCLSLNNTLLLFKVLITQKYKILFVSSHISLITEICEGLTSFLQPFEWQFTYVPVLPYSVFGILDAPVPVLVGMHSSRTKPEWFDDEIIIVNLDKNNVHIPQNIELIDVPPQIFKSLKHSLKTYAKANKVALFDKNSIQFVDSAFDVPMDFDESASEKDKNFDVMSCRAAFYKFWIHLLGPTYDKYLEFPADNDDFIEFDELFDCESFIESRPKNMRKFWKQFVLTQSFQKFIQDLTYGSTEDREVSLRAFYKCCQHEHKYGTLSVDKQKKQKTISMNTSSFSDLTQRRNSSQSTDLFAQYLTDQMEQIVSYQVVEANDEKLESDYEYIVKSAFPILSDKYLIKPRIPNLAHILGSKSHNFNQDEQKQQNPNFQKRLSHKNNVKELIRKPSSRRKMSKLKQQTPIDRAKFLLLQIYGTWFSAYVASLDFRDIPGDEVDEVVQNALNVLYRMTEVNASRDVQIIPDELIYKACLILCGKFGKKKEATKLFKELKQNGITPSQKTYGAYTNAMASSGANMLLSAAGSTSSGTSSMAGRSHRRSFAPSIDGNKVRSLSAALNPNSRLHAPHKIKTIAEDDVIDKVDNMDDKVASPVSDYEDELKPNSLPFMKSSPFVPLKALEEGNDDENGNENNETQPPLNHNRGGSKSLNLANMNELLNTATSPMEKSKSSPMESQSKIIQLKDSKSNLTKTPTSSDHELNENDVDLNDDDDDDLKEDFVKSKLDVNNVTTPSALSSQISASIGSVPEPKSNYVSKSMEVHEVESNNFNKIRVAVIIDYGSIQMESKYLCKCGYVLSDAQIMTGWCSEFTASNNLQCIMCRQHSFTPQLHLQYNVTKMSMQNGIVSFETINECIEYISPLQLRSKINFILKHTRLDFEEPDTFRNAHSNEFWNMIWYFYHRNLDLSFLLGEHDYNALCVKPFDHESKTENEKKEKNETKLCPKSDDELLELLRPIYNKAIYHKLPEAIAEWLLLRRKAPSEKRELYIWNLSVFDSFHDLGIPSKYKTYDLFVKNYKKSCANIGALKMRDRAWSEASLAVQTAFKHPRISNQRLVKLQSVLSGKPQRPNVPVPLPPGNK